MANYEQSGNRYTLLILREYQRGLDQPFYRILPYEYVRFNVDENPSAEPVIVPTAPPNANNASISTKLYERIEFVDSEPLRSASGGTFSALPSSHRQ